MNSFEVKQLTVGYGQREILTDLNFSALQGQITAVLGANGSGKSTLLRTVCGLLAPLHGMVSLNEIALQKYTYNQLSYELAVVLTDNRFETEFLTVRDVVSLGRYPHTGFAGELTTTDMAIVDDALKTLEIEQIAETEFSKLSDGQRQKVVIARALAQSVPLLILDEPTGFLDLGNRHELMSILHRLAREKKLTIILSMHDLDLTLKYCDLALLVHRGEVLSYGTPEQVLTPENVAILYNLGNVAYNTHLNNVELRVSGEPEVFVIGGNGSATGIYRSLAKEGRCFATGILATNDLDYYTAQTMGATIISIPSYTEVSDSDVIAARLILQNCREVITASGCPKKSLQMLL